MSNGELVGAVYIDLGEAFHTIGHGVLLNKLASCGVIGNELAWFTDYPFNRNQIVEINNVHPEMEPIYCGIPQGSILGPLLFIVFLMILRIRSSMQMSLHVLMVLLCYSSVNVITIEDVLNLEMENIGECCRENELLLNLKKEKLKQCSSEHPR